MDHAALTDKPKKRKINGTAKDNAKKARMNCIISSLLERFGRVNLEDRANLI